ncbi:mitochondrial substrate carrier family protein Q [Cyclospora cayetanensis]|uniref:Mitochondrial substrate carrier family protein Q n=1 Tax=Cyclospora cayetanensis TaxID=88456 RepID=A0A6P6RQ71_9EIME|nr:mitochondrial substrate carrier family protein Q [Cyclospora cayetanensis]
MKHQDLPKAADSTSFTMMEDEIENLPVFVSPVRIHPSSALTRVSTVGDRMAPLETEALLPAWKEQLRRSKSNEGKTRIQYSLFPGTQRSTVLAGYENSELGGHWMPQRINKRGGVSLTDEGKTAATVAAVVAATSSPRMSDATHAFLHTIAGAAGAVVAMAVVYPLDSLRTIQSVQGGSAWEVLKLHLRHGGWRRLYKGMRAAVAGVIFSWGTYFFVYTLAKQKEKNRGSKAKAGTNLPMAIGAGVCSTIISNPFWVANTRLKLDFSSKTDEHSIFVMLVEILRKEGFRGWLAGIVPALVLVLNPAIQFALYDHLRAKVLQLKQLDSAKAHACIACMRKPEYVDRAWGPGLAAKLVATLVTYPYLVVKTRAQSKVFNVKDYSSSVRSLIMILETEGLPGLFAGLPSKLTATLLSSAIMFTVYEQLLPLVVKISRPLMTKSRNADSMHRKRAS